MTRDRDAAPATVLAFDFGTRRIGVAVGNTVTRTARALTTIDTSDMKALDDLVAQWQPQMLVVGIPVHADGTPHAMTARAQAFAADMMSRYALPVHHADERHTTELAQSTRAGRKGRAARDEVAAQIILQDWLDGAA